MKESLKKNWAIVIAFLLPVVLIAAIALSTYLPSRFLKTDYNFIYTSCTDGTNYYSYQCGNYLQKHFDVVNNKLVVNAVDPTKDSDKDGILDINENYRTRIFLHDTKKNESREITLAEAEALTLTGLLTSPDGVTVSNDYSRSGDFFFLFGNNSSYGYYLTKGTSKKKLNLINADSGYYYDNNFQFIGWVSSPHN